MSSPFLERPASERILENELAFAIPDAFPLSPGHALVVPRRVVKNWFEATPEEHAAIMCLVSELRALLDRSMKPDGYNVGFNAGEAAGQTVPHLHVHVIPRYLGDLPDPRGGIRWILPAHADYWTPR